MKTLADLKKDLKVGQKLHLIERYEKKLKSLREVEKVQSNSIKMKALDTTTAGWLDYPKTSLLEYDGRTIKIFLPGYRNLTPEEQTIIDNEPSDEKQQEIDMLSDGNVMFYRRKVYYKNCGKEYLFVGKKEKGMYLTHISGEPKIEDDRVKGKLILVYEMLNT